jgi:protein-tyrosine phosphatase
MMLIKYIKNILWLLYGTTIANPKLPTKVKSILFVCKGNICRSPFAEKLALKYSNNGNSQNVYSAGILVIEPKSSPADAICAAESFGVELKDHKSRQINYSMVEVYDMVLVMETRQYKYLRKLFSEYTDKIFLLPLFSDKEPGLLGSYNKYNIKDPYGKGIKEFSDSFRRIDKCVCNLLVKLKSCNIINGI